MVCAQKSGAMPSRKGSEVPAAAGCSGDVNMHTNARTYKLSEVLDIKATVPLAESLLAQRGSELLIDASKVERLGAQSLQILLSAISTWHADGLSIEFIDPSERFLQGIEHLGIDPEQFLNAPHAEA